MWILCFPVSGTQTQWSSKRLARQSQLSDQGVSQFGHWWCMDMFKCLCVTLRNYSWIWNPNIPNIQNWNSGLQAWHVVQLAVQWLFSNDDLRISQCTDRPQTDHWTIGIHEDHLRGRALASPRACPKSTWQGFPGPSWSYSCETCWRSWQWQISSRFFPTFSCLYLEILCNAESI